VPGRAPHAAVVAVLVDSAISVVDGCEIAGVAHHQLWHDVPRLVHATVHGPRARHERERDNPRPRQLPNAGHPRGIRLPGGPRNCRR
jgi:hypothetical protein